MSEPHSTPVRPDPRQPAHDAVYDYIRSLGSEMPTDPVHRNTMIWRAFHAAIDATPVGRCVSSHCVEGDHILDLGETVTEQPTGEPSLFIATPPSETFQIQQPPDTITINGEDGQPLVTIHPDGQLDYGPGYTPDEAARRFWDAMRYYMPARCPSCGHVAGGEVTP